MNDPVVSVLVPSYNHGLFVVEAVESALDSAFASIEVIIVDDGSTDDSTERIRGLEGDERVRVFEQENRGAHAALNRAMRLARGEFIFILNSDDVFAHERTPRMVDNLRAHPEAGLAASWIRIIDDEGKELGIKEGWSNLPPWPLPSGGPYLSDYGDPNLAMLETNFVSTTSNVVIRRTLVEEYDLRFKPLRYAHDWDFILSACHHSKLILVPHPLVDYRVHSSNTIKEGAADRVGSMRFEIQWVVARHAHRLINSVSRDQAHFDELVARAWNSMPSFGCDGILDRLLVLRGTTERPPQCYDDLATPTHPFHQASAVTLAAES